MEKILLPGILSSARLESLEEFFNASYRAYSDKKEIDFDFSSLRFVEPSGYTALFNLIRWLRSKQVKIVFSNYMYPNKKSLVYMDDCGFFEFFGLGKIRTFSSPRSTTMSHILSPSERSTWYENSLATWLTNTTNLPPSSFSSLKVCLFELFTNIKDHSESEKGAFFAQHYPQMSRLIVSISDIGVGIPANVRRVLPDLSDSGCLEKACELGFTTGNTRRNAGRGLDTLVNMAVKNCNGTIKIISLSGYYEISENYTKIKKIDLSWKYPGTSIEIIIDTTKLPNEPPEIEDFQW